MQVTWTGPSEIEVEVQLSLGGGVYYNAETADVSGSPSGSGYIGYFGGDSVWPGTTPRVRADYLDATGSHPSTWTSLSELGTALPAPTGLSVNILYGSGNFMWNYTGSGTVEVIEADHEPGQSTVEEDSLLFEASPGTTSMCLTFR